MSTGRVDLHVHTSASDGALSPSEVVREAAARGVTLLGIADHDITDGIPEAEAAAREAGLTLIPGIELSVEFERSEVHLLGYFIRHSHSRLQGVLEELRQRRAERNARILERLRVLGAAIDPERLQAIAGGGSVGRPHIATALVEAGYVSSHHEAFGRYLADGRPAHVPRVLLSVDEARDLILAAGGLSAVAHPAKLKSLSAVERIIAHGVQGIEVYHCDHSPVDEEKLLALARARSLLIVGGSDSHGPYSDRPVAIGGVAVPHWVGEELLARAPSWWTERR